MALIEQYSPPTVPENDPYTDERGHVSHPLEIPKMDSELNDALQSVETTEEMSPCRHAIERAQAILRLASDTTDTSKQDLYLKRAQAEIEIAKDLLGYDAPLDQGSYELTV